MIAQVLDQESASTLGQIRYWIFVLGYRAGLRISEALSIQVRDIQIPKVSLDLSEFILLVRANRYVDVKSHDSRRQLPLHLLLTAEERLSFEQFVLHKKSSARSPSVMLFSEGSDTVAPLEDAEVHPVIHQAMRGVTGDASLRYHHLRHSLANHLLLAYHQISPPWPAPSHLEPLFHTLGQGPGRSGLYLISQLLGHASPETTLRSYIHCQDWIAHHYLHKTDRLIHPGAEVSMASGDAFAQVLDLFGVKPARIRKWKQRFGMDQARWLCNAFPKAAYQGVAPDHVVAYPLPAAVRINRRRTLLDLSLPEVETLMVAAKTQRPEDLEKTFNLEAGEYACLERAYSRTVRQPTRKGSKTFRHVRPRVYGKSKTAYQGHFVTMMAIPAPASDSEKKIAARIYSSVLKQMQASPNSNDTAMKALRYFFEFHRAGEGYVWLNGLEAAFAFIEWIIGVDESVPLLEKHRSPLSMACRKPASGQPSHRYLRWLL